MILIQKRIPGLLDIVPQKVGAQGKQHPDAEDDIGGLWVIEHHMKEDRQCGPCQKLDKDHYVLNLLLHVDCPPLDKTLPVLQREFDLLCVEQPLLVCFDCPTDYERGS